MSEQIRRSYFYRIADLTLRIEVPDHCNVGLLLPAFTHFASAFATSDVACTIRFVTELTVKEQDKQILLTDVSPTWNDRLQFYKGRAHYVMTIGSDTDTTVAVMKSSLCFRNSDILLVQENEVANQKIASWMTMAAFAQRGINYGAILLHASVVNKDGAGYAFLGKSGTGKSTHSKLWMVHLEHVELLNDDNPFVRVLDNGKVMIYGSPWSGKTACYKNTRIPLKALVRLEQSDVNRLVRLKGGAALSAVLPSCTVIRWDRKRFDTMLDTLQRVINTVDVAQMECLPDAEAATICYNELRNK